tara:strand:- start:808 stop:1350 length:543 start_codon:yes stop_codon:yes gene_type:complete
MYYTYYFQGMVFEEEEIEKDPKTAFLSYSEKLKNIDYLNDFHKKYVDESLSEFDERLHFEYIDETNETEEYDDETGEEIYKSIFKMVLKEGRYGKANYVSYQKYSPMLLLFDWLQNIIPVNRYLNNWGGTAHIYNDQDWSFFESFMIKSGGVLKESTLTINSAYDKEIKPGENIQFLFPE